jgi:hypothetical protein
MNSSPKKSAQQVDSHLARSLGARRSARLRMVVHRTGLPAGPLLDLALELLDLASRKLAAPPLRRTASALGAARWRNVSAAERSRILRRAVEARWAKHRMAQPRRRT